MPVFNTFFKILKKHAKSSMIYLIVFICVCIVFTKLGDGTSKEYQMSSCNIAVFDLDQSEASQRLIDYLSTIHTIKLDYEDDKESLQDRLYYREIAYVLYIEEGFAENNKLSNIKRQGTNIGVYIDGQIQAYLNTFAAAKQAGYDDASAYELTLKALDSKGSVSLKGKESNRYGNPIYYFFQYESYVLLMIMASVLGPILVAFNKTETKNRLSISALSVRERNVQLFLGSVVTSIMIWGLFVVLCFILNKGVFGEKELLATINTFVFTIVASSLSSVLGNFGLESAAYAMMTNVVVLAMCFLGGVFVPMEFFGKTLKMVSRLFPTHWFILANDCIFKEGEMSDFVTYVGVELLFALAFFAIAMVVAKNAKARRYS